MEKRYWNLVFDHALTTRGPRSSEWHSTLLYLHGWQPDAEPCSIDKFALHVLGNICLLLRCVWPASTGACVSSLHYADLR
jgi:hypothetical protein